MDSSDSDEEFYEVEKIVNHRQGPKGIEFYVKWKNYPNSENTWEPRENFGESSNDLINAYFQSLNRTNKASTDSTKKIKESKHKKDSSDHSEKPQKELKPAKPEPPVSPSKPIEPQTNSQEKEIKAQQQSHAESKDTKKTTKQDLRNRKNVVIKGATRTKNGNIQFLVDIDGNLSICPNKWMKQNYMNVLIAFYEKSIHFKKFDIDEFHDEDELFKD